MRQLLLVLVCLFAVACGGRAEYSSDSLTASHGGPMQTQASDGARSRSDGSAAIGGEPRASVEQKLIKNARLTIELKKEKLFDPAIEKVAKIGKGLDGYVVRQSSKSITIKVPAGRLDEALSGLIGIGKVKERDVTTVDVTANYVDLGIRIDNLKKLRTRLQELVAQGMNVKEILEVEKELARVTTELESLEGQMRVLSNQTSFATINVSFLERVRPGPVGWVFYGLYHGVKWLFVWD